jgi:hypothetical protein
MFVVLYAALLSVILMLFNYLLAIRITLDSIIYFAVILYMIEEAYSMLSPH